MQNGKLFWSEGVSEGFKISFVFALVSPFVFAFYYLFVNPDMLDFIRGAYGSIGPSDNVALVLNMISEFIFALALGTFYAAVISFFVKNK